MKILLLSRYAQLGASSRLRNYQYLPYLAAAGIEVTVVPLLDDQYLMALYSGGKIPYKNLIKSYLNYLHHLLHCNSYDLIWIEKEIFPWLPAIAEALLHTLKIPYLVDYDDALFHRYDTHHNSLVRFFLGKKIDAVMRYATMVTVGNDYLAERAYSAGAKRVEYLPTVIDLDRYYKIGQPRQNEVFTIGWIGTPLTAKYLNEVAVALEAVAKKKQIRLLTVGLNSLSLPGVEITTIPWSEDTEVEQINSFDVGIMPLPDSLWERGKCGYKLIQYMACGVPVIASPVGINQKIVEPGKNGFLARTQSEWTDALITLIDNQELARQMGQFGRTKVENEYCLQVMAPRLTHLFQQLIEDQKKP